MCTLRERPTTFVTEKPQSVLHTAPLGGDAAVAISAHMGQSFVSTLLYLDLRKAMLSQDLSQGKALPVSHGSKASCQIVHTHSELYSCGHPSLTTRRR